VKRDLILEIGVENIPAFYIRPAADQLRDQLVAWLGEQRLSCDGVDTFGTPRRLVAHVSGLAERQEAAEELVTGPPLARAFDEEGSPTKAAEGFARSQGTTVAALERVETPRGEYLGLRRKLKRARVTTLVREYAPEVISSLRFPKTMKWEESTERFARPVRWIVCLYGSQVIRFRYADVRSGNRTWRRPWMPGETAVVRSAATYFATMSRLGVVVRDDRRRETIVRLAERAAARAGLTLQEDDGLVTELTYMLEDPRVLVGSFPDEYLRLPPEVVTTAMRSHQRYLALQGQRRKLVPRFITFTDGKVLSPAEVRRGNEKVLNARLADARFYWSEDMRRGVDALAAELDRIVFIEGLGTIGQKVRRVEDLALELNRRLTAREPVDETRLRRAATLAKFDLASEMIKDGKEFTKLQGRIGAHYARAAGENREVVAAIREHYLPRNPGDRVPRSTLGALIGIADRVDTICGCFLAGFTPTGSQDPYGLRRQANGLIRIIRDEPAIALATLIDRAVAAYAGDDYPAASVDDTHRGAIVDFFKSRCEAFLRDQGVPYDVANAVKQLSWDRPGVALDRARDIARLRGEEQFERLITGVKRVGNILGDDHRVMGAGWEQIHAALASNAPLAGDIAFSSERFDDPREGALLGALRGAVPEIERAERDGRFPDVLAGLSGLAAPIDAYFDSVLVNAEDRAVRANRHAFLAVVYAVFARYADFSEIVEGGAPR
jgi:glycyl-tRNA synthetase beta chain